MLTDRHNRIRRFYATGEDYWSALEEIDCDDLDDGFRLTPSDTAIPTKGDVRDEISYPPWWVDLVILGAGLVGLVEAMIWLWW